MPFFSVLSLPWHPHLGLEEPHLHPRQLPWPAHAGFWPACSFFCQLLPPCPLYLGLHLSFYTLRATCGQCPWPSLNRLCQTFYLKLSVALGFVFFCKLSNLTLFPLTASSHAFSCVFGGIAGFPIDGLTQPSPQWPYLLVLTFLLILSPEWGKTWDLLQANKLQPRWWDVTLTVS